MKSHTSITAVLVTGKNDDRFKLAQRAVTSWLRQTQPCRHELLVINDHPTTRLFGPHFLLPKRTRELVITERKSLGELRNIGIENAETDYLVQWDDDDYSGSSRLLWQQEHTEAGRASLLRFEIHCDVSTGEAFANDGKSIPGCGGFPGTMMWPKSAECRFQALGKREDVLFVQALAATCGVDVLKNDPTLYTRFYHGNNTWSQKHVMHRKPGARQLMLPERDYIQRLLQQTRDACATESSSAEAP